ncbi:MAG: SDR family oxidoreductase [Pseudomonadota bacterium]|nr:SDR family oxidoreductase [Pseudomonadota bacterium]
MPAASSLADKVAIVSGGNGSATCRLLAERGARVVVADIPHDHALAVAAALPGAFAVALDLAHMVAFLISDEARYITGQMFVVDGGASAHIPGFARLAEMIAGR